MEKNGALWEHVPAKRPTASPQSAPPVLWQRRCRHVAKAKRLLLQSAENKYTEW